MHAATKRLGPAPRLAELFQGAGGERAAVLEARAGRAGGDGLAPLGGLRGAPCGPGVWRGQRGPALVCPAIRAGLTTEPSRH